MAEFISCQKATGYARSIVGGDIPANKWVRLACKRHLDDLRKSKEDDSYKYYFDKAKAERACKFIQYLPHTKGKWAAERKKLELEPWQLFFIAVIFGWIRKKDDTRRYRRALLFVPRKNGKSALASGIGLYMLAADNEYGAEVYSGATNEKQAWEVFRPAKLMAERTPEFCEAFGVVAHASNISIDKNGSRFEPIIGKPGDGSSPSCAIIDEYHEHETDEQLDTMETGMGARDQPLLLMITTAGTNLAGPCYQMQLDAQKVLEGVTEDDQTFAVIYGIDKDDDWTSKEALIKANPNYGVSINDDFLLGKLAEAKVNARKQSIFKTKHLNVWVGSLEAFFNVQKWGYCGSDDLKIEDYHGRRVYLGLDLASRVDIAALTILIPLGDGDYITFGRYYLPESALENGATEHYKGWHADGKLVVTDGEVIDFDEIKADILDLCSVFEVAEVAYDPFQATMLITQLMAEAVPVVEMRQTVLNFSEPMKALDAIIRSGQIRHNNDPVLTWMISNTVAKLDTKDNVAPRKERPENKIDGVVSLLMALNRAMNDEFIDVSSALDNMIMVDM